MFAKMSESAGDSEVVASVNLLSKLLVSFEDSYTNKQTMIITGSYILLCLMFIIREL